MVVKKKKEFKKLSSVVIVDGVRTPFVKAFGPFTKMNSIDLGTAASKALIEKTGIKTSDIDAVVWGGVILPSATPNLAREIAFDLGLPFNVEGRTVTRACASGMQAMSDAAEMIERGEAEVVLVGGSESTSNVSVELPNEVIHAFAPMALGKGTGPKEVMGALKELYPFKNVLPRKPAIAERVTGELMGESAQKMAFMNDITREAQDEFAVRSHQRAAAGFASGALDGEVATITTPSGEVVEKDGLLRPGSTVEKLSTLKPVFAKDGSLTAGNSSALTDGAAATLLMSEDKAKELGYTPLAKITTWAYAGVDPSDQLLIGPAIAMPLALQRAGLSLDDVDLVDIHEAFAAQVLSVTKMMNDKAFCKKHLGLTKAFGEVDTDKLNVLGSSLAFGHPFAATGIRMATTMARELHRSGKKSAVMGICAAGGLAGAMVLEA